MFNTKKFRAFRSKTHHQLSAILIILLFFLFYVAVLTGYIWMYIVAFIIWGVVLIIGCYMALTVIFTSEGIQLKRGPVCISKMKWTDIRCCGNFSLNILGSSCAETYLFFSRNSVNYSTLVNTNVLPKQTEDFIFLSVQPDVLTAVDFFWSDSKKKNVLNVQSNTIQPINKRKTDYLRILFSLVLLISIVAYGLSQDQRWLLLSVFSFTGAFLLGNMT